MKQSLFLIIAMFFAISSSAQKYWVEASVSPNLDKTKDYKVAILPVISGDEDINGDETLLKMAYDKISLQLSAINRFEPVSKQKVESAVRIFAFGGSNQVKEEKYAEIAQQTGADIILLCDLTREPVVKKDFKVIRVYIQMFDVNNGNAIVYNAKARAKNILSKEAEVELGVQNAMETLKEEME